MHLGFLICERGGRGLLRGLNDFRYAAPFLRRCPAHRLHSVAGLIVVSTRGSAGLEEPQGSGSLAHPTSGRGRGEFERVTLKLFSAASYSSLSFSEQLGDPDRLLPAPFPLPGTPSLVPAQLPGQHSGWVGMPHPEPSPTPPTRAISGPHCPVTIYLLPLLGPLSEAEPSHT